MSMLPIPAVVPAAGKSQRMGQSKQLLVLDGEPLISRVVRALHSGGAEPVIVVTPPADTAEGPAVVAAVQSAGGAVLTPPERPLEMRESVELAIEQLGRDSPPPGFLLTPGDYPGITPEIVRQILGRWAHAASSVVIPRVGQRNAHPIVLPWDLAQQIPALPRDQGINALVAAHPDRVVTLDLPHPELADDLNTPEDLDRWQKRVWSILTVRLFAVAKERAGRTEIEVGLSLPTTVANFRVALALQHPALAELAPRVMIAVNTDYAGDYTLILPGANVALIPPVSGG
jgi:CTP:molybdopterin cytidylyltransferase MocA/molybdopterin converting factor small subunit